MSSYPKNVRAKSLSLPSGSFVVPRLSGADISNLSNLANGSGADASGAPVAGTIVYNTTTGKLNFYSGITYTFQAVTSA